MGRGAVFLHRSVRVGVAALDNIFVERLWRSVKYEEVYLKGYQTMAEAQAGLKRYFQFYNDERFHQSLGDRTPKEVLHWNAFIQGGKGRVGEGRNHSPLTPKNGRNIPEKQVIITQKTVLTMGSTIPFAE